MKARIAVCVLLCSTVVLAGKKYDVHARLISQRECEAWAKGKASINEPWPDAGVSCNEIKDCGAASVRFCKSKGSAVSWSVYAFLGDHPDTVCVPRCDNGKTIEIACDDKYVRERHENPEPSPTPDPSPTP